MCFKAGHPTRKTSDVPTDAALTDRVSKSVAKAAMAAGAPTADLHGGWCGGWRLETSGYRIRRHLARLSLGADCTEAVEFYLAEEITVQASQLAQGNLCTRTSRSDLRQTSHGGSTKA